jgi:prephenate dehydratase
MYQTEKKKKIAIQGVHGAFHEIAARNYHIDEQLEIVPADTFDEVVNLVENSKTDGGMMAIENTIAGSILRNYGLLNNSSLKITGEVFLRIRQNLMALPGQDIHDLHEVHSHPIAIQQCEEFFEQYPHIKLIEASDTALVAKQIQQQKKKSIGAIGSELAAEIYGMNILAPSIETHKNNYTRFLALHHPHSKESIITTDFDKVSICLTLKHEVGSLYRLLGALVDCSANMTKIQSAPLPDSPWEYLFFIDFVMEDTSQYKKLLEFIKPLTKNLRILGEYKSGIYIE